MASLYVVAGQSNAHAHSGQEYGNKVHRYTERMYA